MLPATINSTATPLAPRYIVPQIFCTGSSPSKFKLRLKEFTNFSDIFHQEFSKIPSWPLPGIAGVSFFAARTCWTIFAKTSQIEWMKHPKTVLQGLFVTLIVIPIVLVLGGFGLTGLVSTYLGACRMALYYCDYNKPSDEEYQLYLDKLVNATQLNENTALELMRNMWVKNICDNPILQAGIDACFQKIIEKFLELPDFKIPRSLRNIHYVPSHTRDAIYKKLADQRKGIDSLKTIHLIKAMMFLDLPYGLKQENQAQIFKQYAEDELAVIPDHTAILTSLHQAGLNTDVSQIIIAYTDTDTEERIYRIRRYTEKTLYNKNNILITDVLFSLVHKLSLFYISQRSFHGFQEAAALLSCMPNDLKIDVVNTMKTSPQWQAFLKTQPALQTIVKNMNSPGNVPESNLDFARMHYVRQNATGEEETETTKMKRLTAVKALETQIFRLGFNSEPSNSLDSISALTPTPPLA